MHSEIMDAQQVEGLCQDREDWSSCTLGTHQIFFAWWIISTTTAMPLQLPTAQLNVVLEVTFLHQIVWDLAF